MKSVLITGTSKGIGFETALAFAREGYKVFATMRNPQLDKSLTEYISKESLPIIIYEMDVDSDLSVKKAVDSIIKEHGTIDVLVNNAGIERHGSIEETELSEFRAVMETNYFGVIRCIQAVIPHMRTNMKGCIINVSSVAGKIAISPLGGYSASKFAVEALTEALAQEVKPYNVRVSLVQPGIIDTKMAHDITVSPESIYPHVLRFGYMFTESLKQQISASLVAKTILDIADSDTWKVKHPASPDAQPFLDWRASMTDEQWVDWNAQNDEEWFDAMEATFGMNLRKYRSLESIV